MKRRSSARLSTTFQACAVSSTGDVEKVETCRRMKSSLQHDSDCLHHCHNSESADFTVTSSAVGELSGTETPKANPHLKPPGCFCDSSDCNHILSRDSGYHSRDSGYHSRDSSYHSRDSGYHSRDSGYHSRDSGYHSRDSGYLSRDSGYLSRDSSYLSPLNQPSLLVEKEEQLVPDGNHQAGNSSEGRECTGEQPWNWTLGKEMEDPTTLSSAHSVVANLKLEEKAVGPPEKSCVPAEWKMLPALEAGWAACQAVDREKGKQKETIQGQNCNVKKLIGKKMGLEYVDICKELLHSGVPALLKKIQGYLPPTDLLICAKVSKTWKRIIFGNKTRRQFLKEVSHSERMSAADRYTVSRGALTAVQRVGTNSPQKSSIQASSPAKLKPSSKNWMRNQQLVKKLKPEETLKTCPMCSSLARFLSYEQRAICSSEHCSYDYCSLCFNTYHGSKECARRRFRKRSQLQPQAGSKKSKQNLKRL
ncbi:F-box only protein 5 [Mustelus asterias]